MSKRAEEAALTAYPHKIEEHPKVMGGSITFDANSQPRAFYEQGYEQAEKDLAQDFHADTLIGDKDYAVFHADVEELNGDLYNYCQEQGFMGEVKVIIVEDPGAVEIS